MFRLAAAIIMFVSTVLGARLGACTATPFDNSARPVHCR